MSTALVLSWVRVACFALALVTAAATVRVYAMPILVGADALNPQALNAEKSSWLERGEETLTLHEYRGTSGLTFDPAAGRTGSSQDALLHGEPGSDRMVATRGGTAIQRPLTQEDKLFSDLYRNFSLAQSEIDESHAKSQEKNRKDNGAEPHSGDTGFVLSAENFVKTAMTTAMENDILHLSQQELEEMAFSLGMLRQSLRAELPQILAASPAEDNGDSDAPKQQGLPAASHVSTATGEDQGSGGVVGRGARLSELIRDLLTEPVTIMIVLGLLVLAIAVDRAESKSFRTEFSRKPGRVRRRRERIRTKSGRTHIR